MSNHSVKADEALLMVGPARVNVLGNKNKPVVVANEAPDVTTLAPATAVSETGPDLTMTVNGSGFNQFSIIVFNGHDEPTNYISDTQLSTIVKPSIFIVPAVVPVCVRNGNLRSDEVDFTFT
jgi:hypothetical protein